MKPKRLDARIAAAFVGAEDSAVVNEVFEFVMTSAKPLTVAGWWTVHTGQDSAAGMGDLSIKGSVIDDLFQSPDR